MGRLHSIDTMGLVDGPGIRIVFFLQGCPLRCVFCHNPDSQCMKSGRNIEIEEIVKKTKRMLPYFKKDKGGVTFSGGEPLAQGEFLIEAIEAVKKLGVHVAIDTSGIGEEKYFDEILEKSDLILLDIKHYNKEKFYQICGQKIEKLEKFLDYIEKHDTKVWIRHVMMPNVTDSKRDMEQLYNFIKRIDKKIEKIEILPYHRMGIAKYEALGIDYKLKNMPAMDQKKAKELEKYINSLRRLEYIN